MQKFIILYCFMNTKLESKIKVGFLNWCNNRACTQPRFSKLFIKTDFSISVANLMRSEFGGPTIFFLIFFVTQESSLR